MQIYLARNNVQAGPYSLEELNRMLAGGQVQLTDLAWHEGMSQWQPLGQLTQGQRIYQPAAAPWPTPAPSPLSLEKTPASPTDVPAAAMTTQVTELRISSLYKRISASVVDLCAFLVTMAPILQHLSMDVLLSEDLNRVQQAVENLPQQDVLVAAVLMLGLLVAQCALTVKRGQTLGKLLLGTRIVDLHPVTLAQNARTSGGGNITMVPKMAITVGPKETWMAEKVSIWHAGVHDNPLGQRLTALMISKRLADSAVPMSLLADHQNVQFNYFRGGLGHCEVEMH